MKILHIIDSLGVGGAQTVLKGIFENQRNNKNIFLFALRKTRLKIEIKHKNIIIYNSSSKLSPLPLLEVKKFIEEKQINILHCHLFRSQVYGWLAKKVFFPQIKLIFHENGRIFVSETNNKFEDFIFRNFLKLSRSRVSLFITCSVATKQKLVKRAGVNPEKIKVLYNFVDFKKFDREKIKININKDREKLGIKENDFVVGFAGRLIKRKGWQEFVQAANLLKNKKRMKFLMVGVGKDKDKLKKTIVDCHLQDKVFYLGYASDMTTFYSLLDCFVVPSHWEPMGLTPIEAQAMGVPLVASNVEGLKEVVADYQSVLLFEPKNPQDLVEKMNLFFKNQGLRKRLTKNGLVNAKKYSLKKYLFNLKKVYEEKTN